jgi:ketosteroid isomerase-like protein
MMSLSKANKAWGWAATILATAAVACGSEAPRDGMQDAAGVTATWSQALNAGDATALSALYTDGARVLPPGGPALVGRADIESYWKAGIGTGGTTTTVTPTAATAQGDLLHVEGTYEAKGKDGATLARGQYEQLWARTGGTWRVQHEFWRIDPTGEANTDLAERLTSTWTQAYNGGDAKALATLYSTEAMLSSVQDGTVAGRDSIQSFWTGDLAGKPTSTLTLSDAYVAGDLAHLEGEYKVEEKGRPVTMGRYTQLWMREGGDWRIHRELWWR